MRTLSDITARVSNMKHYANGSPTGYTPLRSPSQKENHAKTKTSPHFMTPTFASKQTTTSPPPRPITPVSATAVKQNNSFLRRVGYKRPAKTARSKKESPKKGLSFPDKLAANIYERPARTPPSVKKPKVSPQNKPLPKPPAVQTSPSRSTLTLIDATEKPLLLSSHGGEEYPILRSRRVISTSPLQDVMRETGSELKRQASDVEGERYPKLGDLTRGVSGEQLKSIYSPMRMKNQVPTPNLQSENEMFDIFQNTEAPRRNVSGASNLSAGAAALEKSTSQDFTEVRQTRTSSLRARLSAGDVVKDRNSKVMGFTDFTASPEGTLGIQPQDSLRLRKEAHTASASTDPSVLSQASVESLNRAPATVIAGSRRVLPRRSGSRGSLRGERPSTASTKPDSRDTASVYSNDRPKSGKDGRRSSIPVPKASIQIIASAKDPEISNLHVADSTASTTNDAEQMQAVRAAINNVGEKATVTDIKGKGHSLGAIEESPRHAYTFRRLSAKTPEYGPTLTISGSARKYIMGEDKENESPSTKHSRLFDGRLSGGAPTGKISSATKKRLERPQSIHENPCCNFVDASAREKKAQSADVDPMMEGLKVVKPLSKHASNVSSVSSPFYDAEELQAVQTPNAKARRSIAQDNGWISPLKYNSFAIDCAQEGSALAITEPIETLVTDGKPVKGARVGDNSEYDPFKYDAPPTKKQTQAGQAAITQKDFTDRQNNLGSACGYASSQLDLLNGTYQPKPSFTTSKRNSAAASSTRSTLLPSTSKSRFPNIRSLFHKTSHETLKTGLKPKKSLRDAGKAKAVDQPTGSPTPSPFPKIEQVHPNHRPTPRLSPRNSAVMTQTLQPVQKNGNLHPPRPATPSSGSVFNRAMTPMASATATHASNNLSHSTNLAMSLLDSARREPHSPKKERLLELGKIMVDVITQGRDAERAVEECRLALSKAEKAKEACEESVRLMGGMVEEARRGGMKL